MPSLASRRLILVCAPSQGDKPATKKSLRIIMLAARAAAVGLAVSAASLLAGNVHFGDPAWIATWAQYFLALPLASVMSHVGS